MLGMGEAAANPRMLNNTRFSPQEQRLIKFPRKKLEMPGSALICRTVYFFSSLFDQPGSPRISQPEIHKPMSQESSPNPAERDTACTGADTPPAAVSNAAPKVMPSMAELLHKAEHDAQEHHDAWLRAKAETENIRKRAALDVANAHKFAIEGFAAELLAVKDSLEAALTVEKATVENLKSGAELTLKQLAAAFEKYKLSEVNPLGQKFDPHRHQAIGMVEAEAEPNTVVSVLQKGYVLHERVVRPALVTVAKAKDA
jgi:molecular chaperone GrpE